MSGTFRTSKRGRTYEDKDRRNTKPARSCLHGGDCPYCQSNRQHSAKRREESASTDHQEYINPLDDWDDEVVDPDWNYPPDDPRHQHRLDYLKAHGIIPNED